MTFTRSVGSVLATLVILGAACSSNSSRSSGTGGTHGTGGVAGTGGTTASSEPSGTGGAKGTGGEPSQGGTTGSGGTTPPGTSGANGTGGRTGPGSGGVATGGQPGSGGGGNGGASTGTGGSGGSGDGGASTGAGGSGRAGSDGSGALGGSTITGSGGTAGSGSGGTTSSGGAGADGGVEQSAGCGKTRTLQNGTITIAFNGASRKYILKVPDSYDNSHAYRLILAYAWSGGKASDVASSNYFTFATQDSKNTIFAAPDAANGDGNWSKTDVQLTDAILAQLEGDLCIDTTRVFATGFSMGGAMAIALACTRAEVFRAVAFFSGADLTGSCPTTLTKPIAYYASQASDDANGMDRTNPMTGEYKQAQFAAVNGCTAEPNSTNFPTSGQPHVCTNYQGCSAGHPTEYCVFNGPHGWEPRDPGQTASWNAPEAWKFITQF
jgi:poly(3-hydroxybutyrate) depolymerase